MNASLTTLHIPSVFEQLTRRWTALATLAGLDDHLREDIGLTPTAPQRRVSPLVNAWLH